MNYEQKKRERKERERIKKIMAIPINPRFCRYTGMAERNMKEVTKILRGESF